MVFIKYEMGFRVLIKYKIWFLRITSLVGAGSMPQALFFQQKTVFLKITSFVGAGSMPQALFSPAKNTFFETYCYFELF